VARAIEHSSLAGELVYDPFLGSGTTLIAAHRLGRKAYGCELEPKYADVILRRAEAEGLDVRKEG
jgi:DNA modification methylase